MNIPIVSGSNQSIHCWICCISTCSFIPQLLELVNSFLLLLISLNTGIFLIDAFLIPVIAKKQLIG